MTTPKWIEEKAEQYSSTVYSTNVNEQDELITHPRKKLLAGCKDDYIAGAMEVYQELEKYRELANSMYAHLNHIDASSWVPRKGLPELLEQYRQLKATER